jgi:hypothetical protein
MPKDFDIDFTALPPKLQMQLWVLALDANTSKVNLAYRLGGFRTNLTYNYGGNLEASLGVRRFMTKLSVDPATGSPTFGLAFRGFDFGASAGVSPKGVSLGLTYGSKLLPFPSELSDTFNSGAYGLQTMAGDIQAAPNNPLQWFKLHSDDIGAITKAAKAGQAIAEHGESKRVGAGLRLSYSGTTGFMIYGGAQLRF